VWSGPRSTSRFGISSSTGQAKGVNKGKRGLTFRRGEARSPIGALGRAARVPQGTACGVPKRAATGRASRQGEQVTRGGHASDRRPGTSLGSSSP
jgi:hypothetical protein